MFPSDCPYGFRIVGPTWEARRLVDAAAAIAGYAACDDRADVTREAYLSAFTFGEDFRRLLLETGSTAGYSGPCWSAWLWWDIDREDLDEAIKDARRLALALDERYCPGDDDLLVFFSGSKGFHIGLPTALWNPTPSLSFNKIARRFAENVVGEVGVTIDTSIYDKVHPFRAPNSRHPKTGLHKRRLTLDELTGLTLDRIRELAREPAPFDLPTPGGKSDQTAADWTAAVAAVTSEGEAKTARRAAGIGPTLNRSTLVFIRNGAGEGDRHRLLFSAAANLGEFSCPLRLAEALLEESALDSGLPPKDVRRQIECGLRAGWNGRPDEPTQQDASGTPQEAPNGSTVKGPPERDTSDSDAITGQSCQAMTGTTAKPAGDLKADLARLWGSAGATKADRAEAMPRSPTPALDAQGFDWDRGCQSTPAASALPALPPPLIPLPPGAVGSGTLDKPCRCGSTEYAEMPISEGRTRWDCRKCRRFVEFGKWYDRGGPTP